MYHTTGIACSQAAGEQDTVLLGDWQAGIKFILNNLDKLSSTSHVLSLSCLATRLYVAKKSLDQFPKRHEIHGRCRQLRYGWMRDPDLA